MVKPSSYVTRNDNGSRCLWVYYDSKADNFIKAIEKGLKDHGLRHGEANVIALPIPHGTERNGIEISQKGLS